MTISPIWGRVPAKRTKTKFGMRCRVADVVICFKFGWGASELEGQKWGSSIDFDRRPYNKSALPCCLWWQRAPAKRTKTKFGMRGCVADVIICFKFYRNQLRGFRVWWAKNGGLPLTLTVVLTTTVLPVISQPSLEVNWSCLPDHPPEDQPRDVIWSCSSYRRKMSFCLYRHLWPIFSHNFFCILEFPLLLL